MKIGVYICHCGRNIAGTVNVSEVAEFARSLPGVTVAKDYRYMCSDPGQQMIIDDIAKFGLDRIVIASCSPSMHQATFMKTVQRARINPYCLERANIREQCSWVHSDVKEATEKAKLLVASAIAKVTLSQPLTVSEVTVIPSAMVIGGGVAGIQAALDIGKAGFKVYLVEKEGQLGGHAIQLDKTFPSLDDANRMVRSKIEEINNQPNIEICTNSQVMEVKGSIGNFKVKIKKNPAQIDHLDESTQTEVGAIIVATGYEMFDARLKPELGYGIYPNVITGLEMERLSSDSGPTHGKILINNKEPKNVVFIQCVGSRDKSVGIEYCSRVCCMSTAKQAYYVKSRIPGAKVTVCYIDVRAFGKGHEQFYEKVQKEGVAYSRGVVSEVYKRDDRLIVRAEDTLLGETCEEVADLVVLATGLRPGKDTAELAKILNIPVGSDGFFLEAHPKLGPVETAIDGIILAGCSVGPKDISDSITQGHAAAVKAIIPLFMGKVIKEPLVSFIDPDGCIGCRLCENACEYGALVFDERKKIMTINEALCRGCGSCAQFCPSGANQIKNSTKKQLLEIITALT